MKALIDGFCQSILACFEDKSMFKSFPGPWFVCRKPYVVSVASPQGCLRTQNRQPFFRLPHLYAPRDGKLIRLASLSAAPFKSCLILLQPRVCCRFAIATFLPEIKAIVTRTNPLLVIDCIHPKSVPWLSVVSSTQYNRLLW